MLVKDNIMSTSISQAVEKIPQMKKMIANAPLCVLLCTVTTYKEEQTNIQLTVEIVVVYLLGYIQFT